jgi:putative component of toxin-antitoxin plasmid stabilization module
MDGIHGEEKVWELRYTEIFERRLKKYRKNHPRETVAVLDNLDTYFRTLKLVGDSQGIVHGWIHPEGQGVKALTEKGHGPHMRATRLYIFPDKNQRVLYVLTIGDKNTQGDDIAECKDIIQALNVK